MLLLLSHLGAAFGCAFCSSLHFSTSTVVVVIVAVFPLRSVFLNEYFVVVVFDVFGWLPVEIF